MNDSGSVVLVLDRDLSVRRTLKRILRRAGHQVETFASAADVSAFADVSSPRCAIVDMHLPGSNSLHLQGVLTKACPGIPIIFISAHGNIRSTVTAMKAGAVDFLTKPVRREALLLAVQNALAVDAKGRAARAVLLELHNRYETLTPREREVLAHVLGGKLNKQIASDLGTAERTIKAHRASIMEKLGVQSVAELVRLAQELGIEPIR